MERRSRLPFGARGASVVSLRDMTIPLSLTLSHAGERGSPPIILVHRTTTETYFGQD